MLVNTVTKIDTITILTQNTSASTCCFLLFLLLYMIKNIPSIIPNINARNSIITPSTTKIFEASMVNAIIPFVIFKASIGRCRTDGATTTSTVVVTIAMIAMNTISIIITTIRAAITTIINNFLINDGMITTTITTSIIIENVIVIIVAAVIVTTATTIIVVVVGINVKIIATKYCSSY